MRQSLVVRTRYEQDRWMSIDILEYLVPEGCKKYGGDGTEQVGDRSGGVFLVFSMRSPQLTLARFIWPQSFPGEGPGIGPSKRCGLR